MAPKLGGIDNEVFICVAPTKLAQPELRNTGQSATDSQMTTLREFVDRREAEVRDQIKALKAEASELRRVRLTLDGTDVAAREAPKGQPAGFPTIKDMIRAVAKGSEDVGMTSSEFIEAIEVNYGPTLERTSLSPQLSRLRRDEELSLKDGRWFPTVRLAYVELPSREPKSPDTKNGSGLSDDMGPDGRGKAFPASTPEGSTPSGSTPATNSSPIKGSYVDDLDDDVPF